MKRIIQKFILAFGTAAMVSFPSIAPLADDTEIYVGANSGASTVRPNVLFIIDTSGSMGTSVTLTNGTYDPSTTYTGSCNASRIYWSTSGTPPGCGSDRYFDSSVNKCDDSSTALASGGSGFYVGRLARYRDRRRDLWDDLSSNVHDDPVECAADYGNHGDGVNTSKLWPADERNGGPWTADENNAISWNAIGDNYTIYSANYMNWYWSPSNITTTTRLQIVKDVFADLVNSTSGINAGLMRFDRYANGGYFLQPMLELNTDNRAILIDDVDALDASGNTPLAETFYESSLFWRGLSVDYGDSSVPGTNVNSVLDPDDNSRYKTPMEFQCQKNFVVYLTDGEPTSDTGADTKISSLPGFQDITGVSSCSGNCLDELAEWMYESDLNEMNDKQNVITYTIGFHTDQQLLSDAARKGGGKYRTAESATDLTTAFTNILTDILAVNTTFIAPAVTVNAFNRLTHRDELYFAVFRPAGSPDWPGNVKRYRLATSPSSMIVDANDAPAMDANTGFFSSSSRSFWTLEADAPDGEKVDVGGAAGKLGTSRNVYTYTGATAPSNVSLTATEHRFHEDNTDLTKAMLGIDSESDDYRSNLVKWSRGVDVLDDDEDSDITDARRAMGDILHNKPVLVTYGGTDANPDITLFVGTNEGFLHAINTSDGSEHFAFIPKELLGILDTRYENAATDAHPYGLDGGISVWHKDANGNRVVLDSEGNLEANEHVYLYAGMRRGGNSYYALDVTNRSAPKLLWQITGGSGDFAELGQTWSRPHVAKIKLHNGAELVDRVVLIFGGGYDTNQDTASLPTDDDIGRAIYIVDAETGERLWWASSDASANLVLTDMTNSIPSDLSVLDVNRDGYADRIYVGDMGGRIWRIDFDNVANTGAATLATGGVFADLSGADAADNRRFYYPPDIALIRSGGRYALSVAVGSGYRAHPLNEEIHDRFYMIRDEDVYRKPDDANSDGIPDYPAYTEANLYDATANDLGEQTGAELEAARSAFNNAKGWYIRLTSSGEKVLASALTFDNAIYFNTFTPVVSEQVDSCAPSQGTARAYLVNLSDATPARDLVANSVLSADDRFVNLVRGGIPPEPTAVFPSDGSAPVITQGGEILEGMQPENYEGYQKLYWRQVE